METGGNDYSLEQPSPLHSGASTDWRIKDNASARLEAERDEWHRMYVEADQHRLELLRELGAARTPAPDPPRRASAGLRDALDAADRLLVQDEAYRTHLAFGKSHGLQNMPNYRERDDVVVAKALLALAAAPQPEPQRCLSCNIEPIVHQATGLCDKCTAPQQVGM